MFHSFHSRRTIYFFNCLTFRILMLFFFFFFQAEDGIRDLTVTGVQTCALPILSPVPTRSAHARYTLSLWSASTAIDRVDPMRSCPSVGALDQGMVTWVATRRDRKSVV